MKLLDYKNYKIYIKGDIALIKILTGKYSSVSQIAYRSRSLGCVKCGMFTICMHVLHSNLSNNVYPCNIVSSSGFLPIKTSLIIISLVKCKNENFNNTKINTTR